MNGIQWYVIRAVSGQEKKIKSYLDNEIIRQKLDEVIPQVLIPAEKVYEMRNGKKRVREKSFFPGYILISADLGNNRALDMILNMPGVLGFLGNSQVGTTSKVPVPLREAEVRRILGKAEEEAQEVAAPTVAYIKGESVKVVDGPFGGFIGTVEEVFDDRKKLNVVVKIFGRNTPVELSFLFYLCVTEFYRSIPAKYFHNDDRKKLNVVVKIFGRNTPVELSYAQVEKEA